MDELIWDMKTTGFGPETMIDTTEGAVPIEWLSLTHRVLTRDSGPQPILAIEKHILRPLDGAYVPLVVVMPDALRPWMPDHPLTLPPQHRIIQDGPEIDVNFGLEAALCSCAYLVDGTNIKRRNFAKPVPFYTVLTPAHELVRANGLWAETLAVQPGSDIVDLATLSPVIYAQLELEKGVHAPAYPCLAEWEGRLLARQRTSGAPWSFALAA